MDETYKVAITRFDNRIRIGRMAELAGLVANHQPEIKSDDLALGRYTGSRYNKSVQNLPVHSKYI